MKNRVWIVIFAVAVLLCSELWAYISGVGSPTEIVGIYQNGQLVERIDLNAVTQDREITLKGEYGSNVILASRGSIRMKSADCPDKICVNHGELKSGAAPIICLPNRIVIKFEDDSWDADAKTGAVK